MQPHCVHGHVDDSGNWLDYFFKRLGHSLIQCLGQKHDIKSVNSVFRVFLKAHRVYCTGWTNHNNETELQTQKFDHEDWMSQCGGDFASISGILLKFEKTL